MWFENLQVSLYFFIGNNKTYIKSETVKAVCQKISAEIRLFRLIPGISNQIESKIRCLTFVKILEHIKKF